MGRRPYGVVMLGVQEDWDLTLDIVSLEVVLLDIQEGGNPTLSLGEEKVSIWSVQEFWNPMLQIRESLIDGISKNPKRGLGP